MDLQKVLAEYGDAFQLLPPDGTLCRWKLKATGEQFNVSTRQKNNTHGSMNPKEPKTFNLQVRKKCNNAIEKHSSYLYSFI